MKRTFLLVFIAGIVSCTTAKRQSHPIASNSDKPHKYVRFSKFDGDSVQYLRTNFIENKERYKEEKFKKLLKDLEFDVKSYTIDRVHHNRFISPGITVSFYDSHTTSRRLENEPVYLIIVTWQTPVKIETIYKLDKANDNSWSKEHEKFFGEQVVKEIYLLTYPISERPEK